MSVTRKDDAKLESKKRAKPKAKGRVDARHEKEVSGKTNKFLMTLFLLVVLAGIVGYYFFMSEDANQRNEVAAFVSLIAGFAVGAGIFFISGTGRNLIRFFKEARVELRRVVWPTMDETKKMTLLVVIVMIVVMLFLMLVDFILKYLVKLLLSFS